jgi:hypothetical protein
MGFVLGEVFSTVELGRVEFKKNFVDICFRIKHNLCLRCE